MKNTIIQGIILFLLAGLLSMSCSAASTKADENNKNTAAAENYMVTFVELGSVRCIPCKMMQPIMKDIEKDYVGQVKVVFHDVWTPEGEPFAQDIQNPRHSHPGLPGQGGQGIFPPRGLLSQGRTGQDPQAARREIMLEALFTWLTKLLDGHPLLGLLGAFMWGILSILLSPCHLASIPLIVGFISQQDQLTTRKAFRISLAFALGILSTIALIGVVTSLLGRMLGDIGRWSNFLVAGIFVLVGLYLLGIIKLELPGAANAKARGKGRLGRVPAGAALRTGARPLHLCLHGADPGHRPGQVVVQPGLRHPAAPGLRPRPLRR